MIECVVHCGDVHIMKDTRHEEYRKVFEIFYNKLKDIKPDRIVVNGDTWNDWVDVRSEGFILLGEFLNKLSFISKVIITKGNHDFSRKNLNRIDTIRSITTLLDNKNIIYYDKTGFYDDENIVWAVWDNADRGNPWKLYPIKKDKNKTYIDLYHDPIENVKLYNGLVFSKKNIPSIKDLLGDISMLNDIHLFQSFNNGTKAYSSSMIQQNYGETINGHGFLIWSINNKSFKFIEIPNEHAFIKLETNPGFNYDKINLISKHVAKYNKIKLDWNDYAPNIDIDNENKLRKYLKDKYDPIEIEIKPNKIYTDIKDSKLLSEIIDINNIEIQQKVIRDYLKDNKYDDININKIIEIDDVINDKIKINSSRNIVWNIDKIWFNNFKSYGDNNFVEWNDVNGIITISGINQQGKTTIIDAICFILYGITLSTQKPEKNGNNRFINKNRKLNYCDGGVVIDINGEKYVMYRRVDREYKKGKEIKAVPMTLDYYKGPDMTDENKLTGERKTSTQKLLDEVLGNFDDFIRMALTNADNLNSLLSMDRSVFIDSIIRDAGYDIFEKKLSEFKEYKKELNFDKVNVNVIDIENEIKKISDDLKDKEDYLSDVNVDIVDIDKEISDNVIIKEDYLRRLHIIDDSILKINVDDVKKKIRDSKREKDEIQVEIDDIEKETTVLPKEFNEPYLETLNGQHEKYLAEKSKRDIEIVKLSNTLRQNEEKINNVDRDINIEKSKYLDFLRNNIAGLKIESRETVNEINNNSNIKKFAIENQKNIQKNELNILKQNGINEKEKISSYTNMLNGDNQICITCNQPIVNKDEEHMNGLIQESTRKIEDITKTGKLKIEKINECTDKIAELEEVTSQLIEDKIAEFEEKVKVIQDKINNFNVSMIQDRVSDIMKNKELAESENESLGTKIDERQKFIEKLETEIKKISVKIYSLKVEKSLYDKYKTLDHKKDVLLSEIKDAQRSFDDNTKLLVEYNKNENLIKENNSLNTKLEIVKDKIEMLIYRKGELMDDKLIYSNEITLSRKVISDLGEKLAKYIEQEKREDIHNMYLKLMHRTGLPTYLLTKNINILNEELNSLLTNINFTLFFDEDLNLKLQHSGLDDVINVLESSGYERTISAVILKITLRTINFKSKPNFMFLDEILNRCVGKSVDKFLELLESLKNKIDKIVIIEHNNEIQSNLIIDCKKDEDGISSFELI